MPFGEHDADITGELRQPAHGVPHVVRRRLPVRSGHAHARVPLVPESGLVLGEALPTELPVALQGADRVPTLTADVFEQLPRGVPTVELDGDRPTPRQERLERFQDVARQAELAAEAQPALRSTMTIESPHRLSTQVQSQVDGGREIPGPRRAFQVTKGLVVARLARGGLVVIMEPVDGLQVRGLLVLLPEGVIEVEVED